MKTKRLFLFFFLTVLLAGCAESEQIVSCIDPQEASGFWAGLLHGFFAPITFLVSLLTDAFTMYDLNNNGNWYDLGFLLGIGGFSGGVFKSRRKKK